LSIEAAIQYIDDIKQKITDGQLRQLFGVGPTLAFVIDTTGSMEDIIAGVIDLSVSIVTERFGTPNELSNYVLSSFNDPTTGPIVTTSNFALFRSKIEGLTALGGGDCPELSMTRILNAINVVGDASTLFMFTDAASKDADITGDVISLAQAKSVNIYIFKFDSNCDDGVATKRADSASDLVYEAVALATGGGYHSLSRAEVGAVSGLINSLTSADNSFILKIDDTLTDGFKIYLISVDSYMTKLTISLRGRDVKMTIYLPGISLLDTSASNVSSVNLSDWIFVTILNPQPGYWGVNVTGAGNFSLDVMGASALHFFIIHILFTRW
jgi:hypothetical protein